MDAQHLRPGDLLLTAEEAWATVVALRIEASDLRAWNLSVAEFETFFVTAAEAEDAVWVHNCAEHTKNARPSTKGRHQKGQDRLRKNAGNEKGDASRGPTRKPPPGHKGPWPPRSK